MKILVDFEFDDKQIDDMTRMVRSHGDHQLVRVKEEEEAVREAADAEVLLGRFMPTVCAAAPNLRWIQSFSAGMDKFLFPEIIERDVVITNMAGQYAPQGGEHAWALLLALSRGIAAAAESKQERRWGGGASVELTGGTLGIVGLGNVGGRLADWKLLTGLLGLLILKFLIVRYLLAIMPLRMLVTPKATKARRVRRHRHRLFG